MLIKRIIYKWNQVNTNETKLTFICSNSTIETLEKGVKYVQS